MRICWCLFCCLTALACATCWAVAAEKSPAGASVVEAFSLRDGDRVVLLGSTFIERDQTHGYLETALTSHVHPARVQFRNLGWSGDNVFGEARAGFGTIADGFEQLKSHVAAIQPTVIFLGYGTNESFEGVAGLPAFLKQLDVLLAVLDETKARIVFVSPLRQEDLGRPLPDPTQHNRDVNSYSLALAKVAAKRRAPYINLYELLGAKLKPAASAPLTDNGLHLTAYGYWVAAPVIEQALGWTAPRWSLEIDAGKRNVFARGTLVQQATFSPTGVTIVARDEKLPAPPAPRDAPPEALARENSRIVQAFGLPVGQYALMIDGQQIVAADAAQWAAGVRIATGPDFEQAESVRQTINAKNQLYFHRWRPQNETYLLGFRKHEQGNNAVEIPQFDPLVADKESAIHAACQTQQREYKITKVDAN